jgi:hypothetical protein
MFTWCVQNRPMVNKFIKWCVPCEPVYMWVICSLVRIYTLRGCWSPQTQLSRLSEGLTFPKEWWNASESPVRHRHWIYPPKKFSRDRTSVLLRFSTVINMWRWTSNSRQSVIMGSSQSTSWNLYWIQFINLVRLSPVGSAVTTKAGFQLKAACN